MTLDTFTFSKHFLEDRCDRCGRCLHECPVLQLPLDAAQAEIRALIETGDSSVLDRCTGCMACNSLCPKGANPHTLIVSRWRARYERRGIPVRGRLVLPYQKPNLFTLGIERLPKDERDLVQKWEQNWQNPPSHDTMLYAGCNMLVQPFLLDSALFAGMPIFGSTDICCGEPLYRMGCWDAVQAVAGHLRDEFNRMGLRRVMVPCHAGYYLFKHVYREVFDVDLGLEVVSIFDWLHDRIAEGESSITPLNKTAVLHDNCWPKASGDYFFDKVRDLLALLGVQVLEPEHTRERALCCGMCAAAARYSLRDIVRASKKRLAEFDRVDADMVVDYCGGCNWLFALADNLSLSKRPKPLYHLFEVLQMAVGETPKHRTAGRANAVVRAMIGPLARGYLTPKRFWIDEIEGKHIAHRTD